MAVSKAKWSFVSAIVCAAAGVSQAAVVYEAKFDGTSGSAITGVTGGTASLLGGTSSVSTATPFSSEASDGYLQVTAGGASQGATLAPDAVNSMSVLSSQVGGQLLLKGGYDFFVRSTTGIGRTTGSNLLRALDLGSSAGNGIRMTLANDSSVANTPSTGTALRLAVFNSTSGSSIGVSAPSGFSFSANTDYHIAVLFTNNGVDTTTATLFAVAGNTAIDTSTLDSTNPAFLASASVNFTNDNAAFGAGSFAFGRAGGADTAARTQAFDNFRIYDSTPGSFSAIGVPEPTTLAVAALAAGGLLARRRRV